MEALMLYHSAICQNARLAANRHGSSHSTRETSAFERSLQKKPRIALATFYGKRVPSEESGGTENK